MLQMIDLDGSLLSDLDFDLIEMTEDELDSFAHRCAGVTPGDREVGFSRASDSRRR